MIFMGEERYCRLHSGSVSRHSIQEGDSRSPLPSKTFAPAAASFSMPIGHASAKRFIMLSPRKQALHIAVLILKARPSVFEKQVPIVFLLDRYGRS
jgi:hypothetical protein